MSGNQDTSTAAKLLSEELIEERREEQRRENEQDAASPYPGSHITCLACGGKGHTTGRDYRGVPYPIKCPGCQGTGRQRVVG